MTLRRCQCGGRPQYRVERGGARGRGSAAAERLECPACGNRTGAGKSRERLAGEWNGAGWCGQCPAEEEYAPFGAEWEAQCMRMRKADLVDLFRRACREKEALSASVRRLRARLERTELEEVVARLAQRGVLTRTGKEGA